MQFVRKSVALVFLLLLLVMGNCTFAHAKASGGTLTVTAQIQTSAMWVQGADGKWTLIVANAADPATTFVAADGRAKKTSARSERNAAPATKSVSKTQNSVSHGGS